jgi:5-(carboxyamino)imidazole ribonucleotide synthase
VTATARLGIIGGGQLGRMLALAAAPMGVRCLVLEPTPDAPARVAAEVLAAAYDDEKTLAELARRCDVVTVELEGVPVDALAWLADRVPVRPGPEAVAIAQDRLAEKRSFGALGIRTAPFSRWPDAPDPGPWFVKARRGGFDGRGQVAADRPETLAAAATALGTEDLIVEGVVDFSRELAILIARGMDGMTRAWPLTETTHRGGILYSARAPAAGARERQAEAEAVARAVADDLGYVGVLAVELFDTGDGLVANEWAPRVHNSGHWTIEGSVTSQFTQHVRAVLGWPLGDTAVTGNAVTLNCIGALPDAAAVLAVPGASLHVYGKEPRSGRKVGHVTVVAPDADALDHRLAAVSLRIGATPTTG